VTRGAPIRIARPEDRGGVVDTVVQAFAADPAWTFLLGDHYSEHAPAFAGALFDGRVDDGTVWITAEPGGVAMWDRPRSDGTSPPRHHIWDPYRRLVGEQSWSRLEAYESACDRETNTAVLVLGVLATHGPQGGIGSALIGSGVARADEAGTDCCLETSSLGNREFYERRGFTIASPVPWDGPVTWWLRRESSGPGG
jgi:hypothetical protein